MIKLISEERFNIKPKNEGILEVPEGKKVYDLPVSHFKNLIDRKGREAIIRAITNLQVWNKNDDPKISKWAKDMKKSLKGYGEKKESASLSEASVYDGFAKQYGQKIKNQNISSMKTNGSEILINYKNGIQMILDMDNPDQSQLDISRLNLPEKGSLDDVLEGMAAITQFQELISDNYQSFLDSLEEMSE